MKKRMNIALCVAMIENGFSYAVCEGALLAAKDIDANLYILPVGIIDAQFDNVDANSFRYQYNVLTSVVDSKSIDAVIIEYGTITSFLSEERKKSFVEQFGDVPLILLAGNQEGYSSVCVDNTTGLQEVIEHLIDDHHCERIGFVSGPMTSQDAVERLNVYKSVVAKRGLSQDEDWIVYGNFSEFSEAAVEELITAHPDVQAIVCANDQMAMGCYNVLKKHHLQPGKDVYVTGFDDSPTCMLLEPNLTSVKAETKELGYLAVKECTRLVKGEKVESFVPTKMVARQSCACGDDMSIVSGMELPEVFDDDFVKTFADDTFERYFTNYFESEQTNHMRKLLESYFGYFLHLVDGKGELILEPHVFLEKTMELSESFERGYIELGCFISILYMLYHCISGRIKDEQARIRLVEELANVNQELMTSVSKLRQISEERTKIFEISLTNITRDMLQNSHSDVKKYETILSKLRLMNFQSSYILTYGEGITHRKDDVWIPRGYLYVKAYHNQEEEGLYNGRDKKARRRGLLRASFMPKNRRVDMLVMPLFSGEEQFGLLLTESSVDYFRYASQLACQVSISIEVLEIIKKQNAIKKELERNLAKLEANNKVLDAMSHTDPLTGIANRRGFEDAVRNVLENTDNYGKSAIALYADMDCLKIVNDEFGHDEGDFALRTIADALEESFRSSDIVARMGGDEFAAFATPSYNHFGEKIRKRIQSILAEKNINDKPYYVNMSMGIYEFTIDENSKLEEIMAFADEALYKEKRNKVKVVYKDK